MNDDAESASPADLLADAKTGVQIFGAVIKMAGKDEHARAAAKDVGKAAHTVTRFVNNALLPIAALNFGIDKAREYFQSKFQSDIAEKLAEIPEDAIVEPKPSIVSPALSGLALSHNEDTLREMYLNLISQSMDARHNGDAHPAYARVLAELTVEEARLLNSMLLNPRALPIAELRSIAEGNPMAGGVLVRRHLAPITMNGDSSQPVEVPNFPSMVDNWIRLGLYQTDYMSQLTAPDAYKWVEERPEYKTLAAQELSGRTLIAQNGILLRTDFGLRFAIAVGLMKNKK